MNPRAIGALAVIGAAVLFGTSATSRSLSDIHADSTVVAAVRLLIGGVALFAFAAYRHGLSMMLRLWRRPLVLFMAMSTAAYQALFFVGTGLTGVAVGTLASLSLAPFIAGVLGWATGAGSPGRIWAGSTALAVVGLAMLTGTGGDVNVVGVIAAIGAGASYAVYTVFGSRLVHQGIPADATLGASFGLGGLLLSPWLTGSGLDQFATGKGIVVALWLGLAATAIAYWLFGIGITRLAPGSVATLNLAEPVVATLFGLLLLGEVIAPMGLVGCLLIVGALALLGISESRTREQVLV